MPANAIIASEVRKNVLLCGIVIRVAELYIPSFCIFDFMHANPCVFWENQNNPQDRSHFLRAICLIGANLLFFFEPAINKTGQQCTNDWRHPEQPELPKRPSAHEERWPRTAGRVHGQIGHRDAYQVDKC